MSRKDTILYSILFTIIIVAANYLVQYKISLGSFIFPAGVLVYPFTFLLTDILSEKYDKKEILRVVSIGIILSILPTIYMATPKIAFASVTTFFIVQILDVKIFHYLKERYFKLWWLRNNASTITSQFFDTVIFFSLAFYGALPNSVLIDIMIGNLLIKLLIALFDTPIFYYLAIRKNISIVKASR